MKFLKTCFRKLIKIFVLSTLIYSCYILLTPLKIELLSYFGIFVYSFFILSLYELFIFIIKMHIDRKEINETD